MIEFGSYADDTTPSGYGENFGQILTELRKHMASVSEWFWHNYLKANPKKESSLLKSFRCQSNKH